MPEIKPTEGTCLGGEELLEKLEYVLFMIHHTAFQRRGARRILEGRSMNSEAEGTPLQVIHFRKTVVEY